MAIEDLTHEALKVQLRAFCQLPRRGRKVEQCSRLAEALRAQAAGRLEPEAFKKGLRARLQEWGLEPVAESKAALQEQVTTVFRSISQGELDLPIVKEDLRLSMAKLRAQLKELCQQPRTRSKDGLREQLAKARRARQEGALEATCRTEPLRRRLSAWGLQPAGTGRATLKAQVEDVFRRLAFGEDLEAIAATPFETEAAKARRAAAAAKTEKATATTAAQAGDSEESAPAPAPAAPAHVLVVLSGLQGSGKSTLSKLLGSIFGGTLWLNQDEIREARGAKTFREGVRAALEAVAADESPRLVLIDKMNHRQEHRQFLFQQLEETRWRERGGRVLLVQLLPDQGSWDLDHLQERIEARGDAHRTLRPSSELRTILERTAQDAEPISKEELGRFDETLELPHSFPTPSKAVSVAGALYKLGWGNALEWRYRLVGSPVAGSTELQGLPPWVQVLPLNPKASEAPDAHKGNWDALTAFFAAEFQRLQKEEEDWRNKGD